MAAQRDPIPNGVFVNNLHTPSIRVKPYPPLGPSDSVHGGPGRASPEWTTLDRVLGGPTALRWRLTQ
jgi:hypothetical protein